MVIYTHSRKGPPFKTQFYIRHDNDMPDTDQTSNLLKVPAPRPMGELRGVFCEYFGEKLMYD